MFAVWDNEAGGFLTQPDTFEGAWTEVDYLVNQEGCERESLEVIEVCSDHPEQPLHGCDYCFSEN